MSVTAGGSGVRAAPSARPEPDPDPPSGATSAPGALAIIPVLAVATLTVAVMAVGSARYGYHRDELYYLWGGEHLDWGFVDHPPLVPALARVVDLAGGRSLFALRLMAAAAVGWQVVAGALIARELGGTRRSQVLAAFAVAVTPGTRAPEMLFGTTAFDAAVWAALLLVAVRLLRTGDRRWWLAFGVVVGVGLEVKWSVGILAFALVMAIALSDRRTLLRSGHAVRGALLAIALWAPNLWWNARRGWPALEFQRRVAEEFGTVDQRLLFVPMVLLLTGMATIVLWGPGLVALLSRRGDRSLGPGFRPLGLAVIIVVSAVLLAGGKPYYVAPLLILLFGAGAVAVDRAGGRRVRSSALVLALVALVSIPLSLPVLAPSSLGLVEPVNPAFVEMVGWPELVATAGGAYEALEPGERSHTVLLTSNYGSAGAIGRDRPDLPVFSAHNSLWFWGPPPPTATTVVTVGYPSRVLERFCGSIEQVAVVTNDAGIDNEEHDRPVFVCRDLARPWNEIWADLRHVD